MNTLQNGSGMLEAAHPNGPIFTGSNSPTFVKISHFLFP